VAHGVRDLGGEPLVERAAVQRAREQIPGGGFVQLVDEAVTGLVVEVELEDGLGADLDAVAGRSSTLSVRPPFTSVPCVDPRSLRT